MTQIPETTLPEVERTTDRDLQRSALHELVSLSTECAAKETEIETQLAAALEASEAALKQSTFTLTQKHESLKQAAHGKHDERLDESQNLLKEESTSMAQHERAQRSKVAGDYETAQHAAKQKLEQATWLADSVLEGTQVQVRKDQAKAEEDYKALVTEINELEEKAFALLVLYRQEKLFENQPPPVAIAPAPEEASSALKAHRERVDELLAKLGNLFTPRLFIGMRPYLLALGALIVAAVIARLASGKDVRNPADFLDIGGQMQQLAIVVGATLAGVAMLGGGLWVLSRSQIRQTYEPLATELAEARRAAKLRHQHVHRTLEAKYNHAVRKRENEVKSAKESVAPLVTRAVNSRDTKLHTIQDEATKLLNKTRGHHAQTRAEVDKWLEDTLADLQQRVQYDLDAAVKLRDDAVAAAHRQHAEAMAALEKRWSDGLKRIQAPIGRHRDGSARTPHKWDDPAWQKWTPPGDFASAVAFGQMRVDVEKIAGLVPRAQNTRLAIPATFTLPALLAFPQQASLLIQADRNGRPAALKTLELAMTRLLTNLPAGRVRFTIFDPIGLGQNFAGFMHLADHDDALVGGRIWTTQEQIETRLTDLTEHMETVIQKYLRNEFETIDDYNAQAGELAEPYRFLVIADFPINFSSEAIQKLNSIASTGARCGVYTLVARDLRAPLPANSHIDELVGHSVNLVQDGEKFNWKDEVFQQFPLTIDEPPAEDDLTKILNIVGRYAKDSNRVEVPFDTIAPKPEQFWSGDATYELKVPVGRMGATRSQLLKLGKGVAQHALIAGKTGSGKSTLLHVLVTNLALWYHPDQVEFYLVDFKKGVEFKTYATHALPHARAIAVESDREFGLSVLQRLDAELSRRGEMFRKLGVQDLGAYRETSGLKLPRTLLIIDEFQEFFSEDDKLAQDAALLIDRLVRQGRAFGIHVLLGSQTIGGAGSLNRSTLGQMAVRVALQTSEADSQLILGDNNSAARLLTRPGEAIYNDQGGLVEANSPFQISWLPDEEREVHLQRVQERAKRENVITPEANVFEGNAPADITRNRKLSAALADAKFAASGAPVAWLGDPVAIKDPTAIAMRRQSGANVLVVGQQEEPAMSIMLSSIVSLATQHAPSAASFYVFDGSPADSILAGSFEKIRDVVPQKVHIVEYRNTEQQIDELAKEMNRRQEAAETNPPAIFVFIYGMQRYRALRKTEDSFSFGSGDEEKKAKPDKQFADLLREGPALGIHVFAWADTPAAVERTIDRTSMREFDNRVLFQMSANDSSNLIDSPAANKLGFHRALAYSEEQGVLEKFRPYAMPANAWLADVRKMLAAKK